MKHAAKERLQVRVVAVEPGGGVIEGRMCNLLDYTSKQIVTTVEQKKPQDEESAGVRMGW